MPAAQARTEDLSTQSLSFPVPFGSALLGLTVGALPKQRYLKKAPHGCEVERFVSECRAPRYTFDIPDAATAQGVVHEWPHSRIQVRLDEARREVQSVTPSSVGPRRAIRPAHDRRAIPEYHRPPAIRGRCAEVTFREARKVPTAEPASAPLSLLVASAVASEFRWFRIRPTPFLEVTPPARSEAQA